MDKRNLAFTRINYILLVVGMAIVVLGFLLMSGSGFYRYSLQSRYFQCPSHQSGSSGLPHWFCINDFCGDV